MFKTRCILLEKRFTRLTWVRFPKSRCCVEFLCLICNSGDWSTLMVYQCEIKREGKKIELYMNIKLKINDIIIIRNTENKTITHFIITLSSSKKWTEKNIIISINHLYTFIYKVKLLIINNAHKKYLHSNSLLRDILYSTTHCS